MDVNPKETIAYGQYVIFQRKDYKRLHLLSEKTRCLFLGKDKIDLDAIIGEKIGSTFKIVPKVGSSRHFILQLQDTSTMPFPEESLKDLGKLSGVDNRTICDDGLSQSLTSGNIEIFRDKGIAPKAIIEKLVENSKTFQIRTEFSQEKYIKKKEKKYFEYITVRHPSIRVLADILYNRDLPKMVGIRIDTLSQLSTTLNLQPDGNYILVENGFNGIVAATLLNSLSHEGRLIHVTPGNQNQKQAVLAMNFTSNQMSCLITVRLATILGLLDKAPRNSIESSNSNKNAVTSENNISCLQPSSLDTTEMSNDYVREEEENEISPCSTKRSSEEIPEVRKRKYSNVNSTSLEPANKKPRWAMEAELAVELILKGVDGLVIVCKEYPSNILLKLLKYLLPSRSFVIYSLYQEPLVDLYVQLKQRQDIVFLRITETWLRPYQVLPERTHPAVTVSSSSGFLLSGIKVINN